MKKLEKLILILFLGLALNSCGTPNVDTVNSNSENNEIKEVLENYDIYSQIDPVLSEFNKKISENTIDKDYNIEFSNTQTTAGFIALENRYIEIWKAKINEDLPKLLSKLSDGDADVFLEAQNDWEKQLNSTSEADYSVLNGENSNILGSSFEYTWKSNIREQYRKRAIHLEYLIYLLEKGDQF